VEGLGWSVDTRCERMGGLGYDGARFSPRRVRYARGTGWWPFIGDVHRALKQQRDKGDPVGALGRGRRVAGGRHAGPTQACGRRNTRRHGLQSALAVCGFGLRDLRRRGPAGDPDVEGWQGATRQCARTRAGTWHVPVG
jgi:hypothetical protein